MVIVTYTVMVILEGSNSSFGGFSGHMRAVGVMVVMVLCGGGYCSPGGGIRRKTYSVTEELIKKYIDKNLLCMMLNN